MISTVEVYISRGGKGKNLSCVRFQENRNNFFCGRWC